MAEGLHLARWFRRVAPIPGATFWWSFLFGRRGGCVNYVRVKPHILFVDDEAPIRELLALYFRKRGYKVTTAICSSDALKLVAQGAFQLAILDVDIAGENGLELLTALKARHADLPVIMFTGLKTDEDLLAKSMALGADAFMRKTDSLHELFGEVQRFALAPSG